MDLKQLSYFMSVADAQGFVRAGSKLRMSQPALSRQVRALERELGVDLFVRHGRGVALTEAGVLLRERANGILRHIETLKSEVSARALQPFGELRVGLPAAFRDLVTPKVVGAFNAAYPGVSLLVMELTSVGREEAVAAGVADLAVITAADVESSLVSQPLVSESIFLVGAPSGGLSPNRAVDLHELSRLPLVQNTWPNGVRLVLERAMGRRGLTPRTALEVDSQPVTINLASQGNYYACVPYSAIHDDLKRGHVSAAPVAALSITWKILSAPSRPPSLAGRTFEAMLRAECASLIKSKLWRTGKVITPSRARASARE